MGDFSKRLEAFIPPAIVLLVGLSAFGLGRLSVGQEGAPRLIINAPAQVAASAVAGAAPAGQAGKAGLYVASKSGTKYYLPSCSGVARINEENKVWFGSVEEARAAGYEPAANCAGL